MENVSHLKYIKTTPFNLQFDDLPYILPYIPRLKIYAVVNCKYFWEEQSFKIVSVIMLWWELDEQMGFIVIVAKKGWSWGNVTQDQWAFIPGMLNSSRKNIKWILQEAAQYLDGFLRHTREVEVGERGGGAW